MRKLLITGASGLLGSYLVAGARNTHEIHTISHHSPPPNPLCNHDFLDLTAHNHVIRYLERTRPEIIVHCAALTDVEQCEAEPNLARAVNTEGARRLAHWAGGNGVPLVLISTDSVFDGTAGNYRETDAVNPLNVYARSKLAAERAVIDCCSDALIIRTNFFGWSASRRTLAEWMFSKLLTLEKLKAFADVRFSPLFAGDLAELVLELIRRRATGVFHVSATDSCSKHKFALMLAQVFRFSTDRIEPVSIGQLRFRARRPRDTSLCPETITGYLRREMPNVMEGIIAMRDELDGASLHESLISRRLAVSLAHS